MAQRLLTCCNELPFINFSQAGLPDWSTAYVKLNDLNLWFVMVLIIFNPLFWNLIGRWVWHRGGQVGGCRKLPCVVFGLMMLTLGLIRFCRYKTVVKETQPFWPAAAKNTYLVTGYLLIFCGLILIASSYWALGFYRAHLGECYSIVESGDLVCFPYRMLSHPLYTGTTMLYIGLAFIYSSQTGFWLSLLLALMYWFTVKMDRALLIRVRKSNSSDSVQHNIQTAG